MPSQQRRNRQETEQALVRAVGDALLQDGFARFGVNAIARHADVDKALIYRYFGGLDELLQRFTEQTEIWWQVDDMAAIALSGPGSDSLADSLAQMFNAHMDYLIHHLVTLEIIAWEMADRNALTIALEYQREQRSLALMKTLLAHHGATSRDDLVRIGPVMAMLNAAGNYLAARSRHVQNFNGLDLRTDRGWQQLHNAVRGMLRSLTETYPIVDP